MNHLVYIVQIEHYKKLVLENGPNIKDTLNKKVFQQTTCKSFLFLYLVLAYPFMGGLM